MQETNAVREAIGLGRRIFPRLADELSRRMFSDRLLYSLSGDMQYIWDMIGMTKTGKQMEELISQGAQWMVFGAGLLGGQIATHLAGHRMAGFIDNDRALQGKKMHGQYVYSLKEVCRNGFSGSILIANYAHHWEIRKQLVESGIPEERVFDFGQMMQSMLSSQYFDLQEMPHAEEEAFVDVGALDGGTVPQFIRWSGGRFRHIYCLEPDERNREACRRNLSAHLSEGTLSLFAVGAGAARRDGVKFAAVGTGESRIDEKGESIIQLVPLDELLGNERITFIKMDIEGAEYDALLGAERIIREQRPKLAISLYHKPEDVLEIPSLILQYEPDYRFYVRHYSLSDTETVLYAI